MAIIKIKNPAIDLDAAEIPNLPASKITSGTLDNARISLDAAEIPNLDTAKITTGTLADARLPANSLNSNVSIPNQSAFKNLFINGDMSIAQRGTTSSSTGYQTVDRWQLNTGTQQEQKTDTPDARFSNSFEVTGTTSGSSGYGICSQRIESKNVLQALGQTCTLSAYVKNTGTSTVNVSVEVYRANSTDNFSGLTLLTSLTGQAITTSWNRITFPSFTVTDACATGLEVRIFRYDASNHQEWLLTGVQLEVGTTASDFEFLPTDVNKNRCLRYYYVHAEGDQKEIACGFYYSSSYLTCHLQFPQEMRTAPSLVKTSGTNYYRAWRANSSDNFDDFNNGIQSATTTSCGLDASTGVSGTQGEGNRIITVNSSSLIAFNAEL